MIDSSQVVHETEIGTDAVPFGPNEEKAIISLAFSTPEFFGSVGQYLEAVYFNVPESKFVYAIIEGFYKKHETVPTRGMVRDAAMKLLTVEDDYESILEIINHKINLTNI